MAAGVDQPADFEGVPDLAVDWLSSLDRGQLCRIACTSDNQLSEHVAGRALIPGLRRYGVAPDRPPESPTYEPGYAPAVRTMA